VSIALIAAVFSIPVSRAATDGQWATTAAGNWATGSNWVGTNIASGSDATATFDTAITGTRVITVDSGRTIGHIVLDSPSFQWQFSGSALTLATTTGAPSIESKQGTPYFAGVIAGTQGFTKLGAARIYLAGNNTYSGITSLDAGSIYVRNSGGLGATGAGNDTIVTRTGSVTPVLHVLNNINTAEGITLRYTTSGLANTLVNDSDANTLSGSLKLERAGTGPTTDIYTFGVLASAGTLTVSGPISGSLGAGATSGNAGTNILQINAASGSNVYVTNVISEGSLSSAGGLSLTKISSGTLTLAGSNTYTGATTVSAGTLLINGDQTLATGAVNVSSGATLGGSGTIGGTTTISSGGTLAPGNSPGVITFKSALTLAGATNMELNGTTLGTTYDGINTGTGLLTYGGTLTLTFGSSFLTGGETFDLFTIGTGGSTGSFSSVSIAGSYVTGLTNTAGVWSGTVGSLNFAFTQATGELLVTSAIPEPSTYAAIFGSLALVGVVWKRRQTGGK
jgi:autotransporter-associated beta strand protein